MLSCRDLSFSYNKNSPVLKGVNIRIESGETCVLLGENGAGKTTLLKCLLGILKPTAGSVYIDGKDIKTMPRRERAKNIAYVPQSIDFGELTVEDTVLTGRVSRFNFAAGKEDRAAARRAMEETGIVGLADRMASELSGGERQKVAVARALAQEPEILVFDEPTGNLDLKSQSLLRSIIKELAAKRGIAVVIAIHDVNFALSVGDKFCALKDGSVAAFGGEQVLTEETLSFVYSTGIKIADVDGKKYIIGG